MTASLVQWLRTPREVRGALVYVLQNWFKHARGAQGVDPMSSAAWFDGWRNPPPRPVGAVPVRAPRTWLARVSWVRHGRLDINERPRRRSHPRAVSGRMN